MRLLTMFLLLALAAAPALAQTEDTPETLNAALEAGYEIVSVVGQGVGNKDHVIYLKKDARVIVCGFRFVLTDEGFDDASSRTLGVCSGFK